MNRYLNIAIPGIFLPLCAGTVYNWSQYSKNISELLNLSLSYTNIGFTLIIFFLGMGAAFLGRKVELNPKKMSIIGTLLFCLGFLLLSLSLKISLIPLFFISCSIIGCGTGIIYLVPIKQLLSNFADHKGLASGLAITGFGLGKFVASPAIEYLLTAASLPTMFLVLAGAFLLIMSVCSWLFKPNPVFISTVYTAVPISTLVKHTFLTKQYISVWLMFCINISCGLAIISQEKGLLTGLGFKEIATIMSLTAVFNILGRFGMSTASDHIGRKAAYHWVCSLGILASFMIFTGYSWLALLGILLVEFAYGGNFSCLPSLLAKRFGDTCVSTVHAMTLSGWGIAGIIGPVLANTFTGSNLYLVMGGLYLFGFLMMTIFVKKDSQ